MVSNSGDDIASAGKARSKPRLPQRRSVHARQPHRQPRLFADEREIIIAHGEETYRLRLTSQNKLILTK